MFELFEEVNHLVSLCVSRIFGGVFDLCILLYKRTTNLNSRTDFSRFESCAKRTFCGIAREVDKRISPGQILWNIHLCRTIRSHARSGKDNLRHSTRQDFATINLVHKGKVLWKKVFHIFLYVQSIFQVKRGISDAKLSIEINRDIYVQRTIVLHAFNLIQNFLRTSQRKNWCNNSAAMFKAFQHVLLKAASNLIGVHISISGFLNHRKRKFKHPIRKVWYIEEHVLVAVVAREKQINCFVFLPTDLNENARSSHQVAIHKECCLDIRTNLDSLIILARMNQSHGLRHIGFAVQRRMILPFCNIS